MSKAFYVTTPIYYVNDAPHIGHAYTTTAADVLARWHRQRQESVFFLTGVDEHGTKVELKARANDMEPQDWSDRLVESAWQPVLHTIDASNDDFIRTTSDRHRRGVQAFWDTLRDNGFVYKELYEGPYCVGCEEFKLPGDLEGDPPQCPIHHRPVEMLSEQNYFFALAKFTEALLEHYERHPDAVEPRSAYNEVVSFIKQGLRDISMSRSSVGWGIPLSWDPDQVVYVWFDALLNYITAIGYGDPERDISDVWPADVQLVGKDILRFHAVYWPAMLMAAGLPLPRKVYAHGWLLVGGEKMSKSKLTGIAPEQVIDHFGSDAFRYYFLRAIAFGQDGSFSWEDMSARYQSELANGLGNLASRATAMVGKYCAGVLPAAQEYANADLALQEQLRAVVEDADAAMGRLEFSAAILRIRDFVDHVNLYVTEQAPWVLAKDPGQQARLHTVLYTICESLRAIAVLYHPVMPKATAQLWEQLGAQQELPEQDVREAGSWGVLTPGVTVTKGAALFPRLDEA